MTLLEEKFKQARQINKDVTALLTILDSNPSEAMARWVYDLVFPELVNRVAYVVHVEWSDPDTTYEEDARAFLSAAQERLTLILDFEPLP